jgi:GNAT superfamily N-acetyltransferase
MIVTEFLSLKDYPKYGEWLKQQDAETRELYFGIASADSIVDSLMKQIQRDLENHYILVAKEDDRWVGTVHIATSGTQVEFGLLVLPICRGEGIASLMLEEALAWARNRNYKELFMHCLTWNKPINHLCHKHGLSTQNMYGDSEVRIQLDPPNLITLSKEVGIKQRNLYHTFLNNSKSFYQEIYG